MDADGGDGERGGPDGTERGGRVQRRGGGAEELAAAGAVRGGVGVAGRRGGDGEGGQLEEEEEEEVRRRRGQQRQAARALGRHGAARSVRERGGQQGEGMGEGRVGQVAVWEGVRVRGHDFFGEVSWNWKED